MMAMNFVTLNSHGTVKHGTDEIILSCYGPRGGLKACVGASPEAMRELRDQITDTLDKEYPSK